MGHRYLLWPISAIEVGMDMNESAIKVSHIEKSTDLLGPFNRFVIWVHGCCFNCKGCLATNAKIGSFSVIAPEALAEAIVNSDVEGVTISGGEPFLQAYALGTLIQQVRAQRDIGVIVYSGFTLDELKKDASALPLLDCVDVLIDGRYIQELDDGKAYVGSSNQMIHYLTERYSEIGPEYYSAPKRRAEIKFTPSQAILIGVPSAETLSIWNEVKKKSGGIIHGF